MFSSFERSESPSAVPLLRMEDFRGITSFLASAEKGRMECCRKEVCEGTVQLGLWRFKVLPQEGRASSRTYWQLKREFESMGQVSKSLEGEFSIFSTAR